MSTPPVTTTNTTVVTTVPITTPAVTTAVTTTTMSTEPGNPTAPPITSITLPPSHYLYHYSPPGPSFRPPLDFHPAPFSYHLPNYTNQFKENPDRVPQATTPPVPQAFNDPASMSALKTIETYSGGNELEPFLDNVATVAECYKWTDSQVVTAIKLKLRGEAQSCFYSLPIDKRPATVYGMREWLVKLFGKRTDFGIAERDFFKIYRKKDESLRKFALRLEIAAAKLFPGSDNNEMLNLRNRIKRETIMIKQFFEGLDTRLANEVCRIRQFETVEEALPYAEHCEKVIARLFKETKSDAHKVHVRAVTTKPAKPATTPAPGKPRYSPKKPQKPNQLLRTDQRYQSMRGRCFNCGSTDHVYRKCPKPKQVLCYNCVKPGHRAEDESCPLNSKTVQSSTQSRTE